MYFSTLLTIAWSCRENIFPKKNLVISNFLYLFYPIAILLPVYLHEMASLTNEETSEMRQFFSVYRSQLPFSGTAMDQVIEQTVNRSCKSSGGIKGVTLKPGNSW